jgi:hypothetical protein
MNKCNYCFGLNFNILSKKAVFPAGFLLAKAVHPDRICGIIFFNEGEENHPPLNTN